MPELVIDDMQGGYIDLVQYVRMHGRSRSPRGLRTRDVEDMTLILESPERSLTEYIGRKASTKLAALEALQLVAGEQYPDLMVKVAPNTKAFLSDDGQFHGAYGPRIKHGLPKAIRRMIQDSDTRQAVVSIFRSQHDLTDGIKDVPCTTILMYKIEDDALHAKTVMRSNDVWWGVAHDVFMFTVLQRTVAAFMGLNVGTYRHNAYSMHMYERDFDASYQLHLPTKTATVVPPIVDHNWRAVTQPDDVLPRWGVAATRARSIVMAGSAACNDWWGQVADSWLS